MTPTLREQLIAAKLADSLSLGHNTAAADVALGHVRAWLADEDTVKPAKEALRGLKLRGTEPALPYNDFAIELIARRVLTALAAALAPKEATS